MYIWRFPEMEVPPNHGFHFWVSFLEPPYTPYMTFSLTGLSRFVYVYQLIADTTAVAGDVEQGKVEKTQKAQIHRFPIRKLGWFYHLNRLFVSNPHKDQKSKNMLK